MQRIEAKKINNPSNFDMIWEEDAKKRIRQYDKYRHLALRKKVVDGYRVVELGCGCSEHLQLIKNKFPKCEVHGLDYSKYAIKEMQWYNPQIKYKLGDALKTGYPSNWFDVVMCGETIEHIEIPEDLIIEMKRIVKPKGWVVISTPNDEIHLRDHTDAFHLWSFELKDIKELFAKHFGISEVYILGNYIIAQGKNKL